MDAITNQLKSFLQFYTLQLIDHPQKAQLRVAEVDKNHVRFRLILDKSDVALLIGRNGFTASAIRSVMKAAAEKVGAQVSLQIQSVEEEEHRSSTQGS